MERGNPNASSFAVKKLRDRQLSQLQTPNLSIQLLTTNRKSLATDDSQTVVVGEEMTRYQTEAVNSRPEDLNHQNSQTSFMPPSYRALISDFGKGASIGDFEEAS